MNIDLNEVNAQLSKYVELVEAGQTIVICKQNVPVAEIRPIATLKGQKPVLGSAAGTFTIPPSFFEPLPSDVLNVFEGDPSADPIE